jgi:hypothetical protein
MSLSECNYHQTEWKAEAGRLAISSIPPGLKIAMTGEMLVSGGSFLIVYQTNHLNKYESFKVYMDGQVKFSISNTDANEYS